MSGHVFERCRTPRWTGAPWNRHRVWVCECGTLWRVYWAGAADGGAWYWRKVGLVEEARP